MPSAPVRRFSVIPMNRVVSRRTFGRLAAGLALQRAAAGKHRLSAAQERFLEDLSRRAFRYFWEQTDPRTGLVHDRARTDGRLETSGERNIASIAATGFGLTALCIAAERRWIRREEAADRVQLTLRFFAEEAEHQRGWFYHFMDASSGVRAWKCEISSIDTALLLAGALTARQYFAANSEITELARRIYERTDFRWMLNDHPHLLSHGWKPETGFLSNRWDDYSEHMVLYLMAIGSPTSAIPPEAWYAWRRELLTYAGFTYIDGDPLFVHQYSHAWVDFRGRRENRPPHIDWFENSVAATHSHRAFCLSLRDKFPGCYSENVWGITASDSRHGYVAWHGPPPHPAIDGTVVPCAAAGSLMFAPEICLPALQEMKRRFGRRIWGRYGFADAFHPVDGWVNPDVIGIDVGITLLSAENLRTGNVWRWFMNNVEISRAMDAAGLERI